MTTLPVVAVDVTPSPNRTLGYEDTRTFRERLAAPVQPGKRVLFVDLLSKAFEIPQSLLNDIRIAGYRPEIYIKPRLDPDLKPEDFKRMDEAIEAGYEEAVRVLNAT